MSLPKPSRKTRKVRGVEFAPLTRAGALHLHAMTKGENPAGEEAVEKAILRLATGATAAEVDAWYDAAPAGDVEAVVDAIIEASGMGETAGKASSAD